MKNKVSFLIGPLLMGGILATLPQCASSGSGDATEADAKKGVTWDPSRDKPRPQISGTVGMEVSWGSGRELPPYPALR